MQSESVVQSAALDDDARLASLGYQPQLNRVLGLFANFSVAFTYLSPMVGIYSLFVLGVGDRRPGVRLADLDPGRRDAVRRAGLRRAGQPLPGGRRALPVQQVLRRPGYGWFVGWFYGIALLITVAAVDTGVVALRRRADAQLVRLEPRPDQPRRRSCVITVDPAGDPDDAQHHRRQGDGPGRAVRGVRRDRRHLRHRDHPRASTASTTGSASCSPPRACSTPRRNPLGLDFGGNWLTGAALIAVLAPVYIFYGFESAGDISEETKDAGRQVPRAMRLALIWGGIASFVLIAALLLAMPGGSDPVGDDGQRRRRAVHPRRAARAGCRTSCCC